MKPSGIGGMAVIEGVMMKNKDEYAVAVRKPNNEIAVEKKTHKNFADKVKLFKLPIFRGILAFADSMVIGVKVLNYAASFFEDEEEQTEAKKKKDKAKAEKKNKKSAKDINKDINLKDDNKQDEKSNALLMAAAVVVSLLISVTFFMVLPVLVSNLFAKIIDNRFWLSLLEGLLRIVIFIGYILAVSLMPDIKRVFMYHGAEHKSINCLENGFELTLENVKWQSKQHKRCGTSFMLLVMFLSVIFFVILQPKTLVMRVLSRILLVPVIAGLSYEFIRLAGKSNSRIVNILSKPGLWMQGLTTKEPDDSMIEVAIMSVNSIFDWRAFLETSAAEVKLAKKSNHTSEQKKELENSHSVKNEPAKSMDRAISITKKTDDEDDEILKALDKYLDLGAKDSSK